MRKDNRGMTLIELLVAITMLGVVISPFLKTFTMSARQNNKARETLRATTVAQNLMEGLEAFSLEDVCNQVNKNTGPNSMLYRPHGYEEHAELGVKLADNIIEKSGNGLSGEDYVFANTSSNKYEIGIKGIEEDGKKYDAKIFLDASGYPEYNEVTSFEVDVMNEATDVIFSLEEQDDKDVLTEKTSWNWANIKRTFKISVIKQNDKKPITISITVEYTNGNTNETSSKKLNVSKEELNNLYIMYYPNYHSTASNVLDVFDVDFKADVDFNLFLVKQRYTDTKDESSYCASLSVKDTNPKNELVQRITLRTNILENLYVANTELNTNALKCDYKFHGADKSNELLGFRSEGIPQGLSGKKERVNAVYKTKVEVYPEGTYPDHFDTTESLAVLSN